MKRSMFEDQQRYFIVNSGPDHTLPLRMQSWGCGRAAPHYSRLRWFHWQRAIRSRRVWRSAARSAIGIGSLQTILLASIPGRHLAPLVLIPLGTLTASVISAAIATVQSLDAATRITRN